MSIYMRDPAWPDYAEVLPNQLYVGGKAWAPEQYDDLAEKVSLVIDCRLEWESPPAVEEARWRERGVDYLRLPVDDDFKRKDTAWFDQGISAALDYIASGEAVYIHCNMGINRGPSMAYAILRAMGQSRADAFHLLLSKRSICKCAYREDADRAVNELGFCEAVAA